MSFEQWKKNINILLSGLFQLGNIKPYISVSVEETVMYFRSPMYGELKQWFVVRTTLHFSLIYLSNIFNLHSLSGHLIEIQSTSED